MEKSLLLVAIVSSALLCQKTFAQKGFALIEKNKHRSAKELFHDLNETKDTLILNGEKRIRYVYSINQSYKRETQELINANSAKVALNHLSKGKHVFVVEQVPLKIVFVVRVLEDTRKLDKTFKSIKVTAAASN